MSLSLYTVESRRVAHVRFRRDPDSTLAWDQDGVGKSAWRLSAHGYLSLLRPTAAAIRCATHIANRGPTAIGVFAMHCSVHDRHHGVHDVLGRSRGAQVFIRRQPYDDRRGLIPLPRAHHHGAQHVVHCVHHRGVARRMLHHPAIAYRVFGACHPDRRLCALFSQRGVRARRHCGRALS